MTTCRWFLGLLTCCLAAHPFSAQETPETTSSPPNPIENFISALFTTDNTTPLTGMPVGLTLIVETPSDVHIADWPEFPDRWSSFDVRETGEIKVEESAETDGNTTYRQTLLVYLWTPGEHETRETLVGYRFADDDTIYYIPAHPVTFDVPTVLESPDLNELFRKPYRPPVSAFYLSPWIIVVGLIVLLGVGWVYLRWLARRRLIALATKSEPTPKTPGEAALAELSRINDANVPAVTAFISVANCVRQYIQNCFDLPALDMTTYELVSALARSPGPLDAGHLGELRILLEKADLVKFANVRPDKRAARWIIAMASRWILATAQSKPDTGKHEESEAYFE